LAVVAEWTAKIASREEDDRRDLAIPIQEGCAVESFYPGHPSLAIVCSGITMSEDALIAVCSYG
jgi:hypothetical protein